jgi:hypothetical protein
MHGMTPVGILKTQNAKTVQLGTASLVIFCFEFTEFTLFARGLVLAA